jgi:hypothetical protein
MTGVLAGADLGRVVVRTWRERLDEARPNRVSDVPGLHLWGPRLPTASNGQLWLGQRL